MPWSFCVGRESPRRPVQKPSLCVSCGRRGGKEPLCLVFLLLTGSVAFVAPLLFEPYPPVL